MKTRNVVIVFAFALCAVFQSTFAAEEETYTGPTYAELQAMNPLQDHVPDATGSVVSAGREQTPAPCAPMTELEFCEAMLAETVAFYNEFKNDTEA